MNRLRIKKKKEKNERNIKEKLRKNKLTFFSWKVCSG